METKLRSGVSEGDSRSRQGPGQKENAPALTPALNAEVDAQSGSRRNLGGPLPAPSSEFQTMLFQLTTSFPFPSAHDIRADPTVFPRLLPLLKYATLVLNNGRQKLDTEKDIHVLRLDPLNVNVLGKKGDKLRNPEIDVNCY